MTASTTSKTYIGSVQNDAGFWVGKVYEWDGKTLATIGVTGRAFATKQAAFDEACVLLATTPMPEDSMGDYFARNSE